MAAAGREAGATAAGAAAGEEDASAGEVLAAGAEGAGCACACEMGAPRVEIASVAAATRMRRETDRKMIP